MSEPGERGRVASVVANCWVIRVGARASIVALDVAETEHRQHCRYRCQESFGASKTSLRRCTSVSNRLVEDRIARRAGEPAPSDLNRAEPYRARCAPGDEQGRDRLKPKTSTDHAVPATPRSSIPPTSARGRARSWRDRAITARDCLSGCPGGERMRP